MASFKLSKQLDDYPDIKRSACKSKRAVWKMDIFDN